ncbi:hypothetical protein H112_07123 [Trichophyton rubrum D6]|uniref:Uncharacterized protein n=4 Tax=Trichophyton TaxID=5550 RepID=F2SHA3_TRIRC|nr:uncharacterized protein TERG_02455 [Trichophyton rubrum CBS 118892]EZF11915.1 hypothetical protein H100_07145 [Trichophyton rubrum MR850]EZF38708.1 hypothetical protein H102_07108 [Trichophyton rubrum CBS 100081]EZF49332.1 hypothetical protein H103_07129 [Trichophyton rubrum CBS 288.86]EZF60054.1 hypothetical protein H104_07085 [Trichophyton rubrum CBS 289.86]EZF70708.1 hypothetical protein H105_07141 [Trichophyton soudanense CBS 452.61]EZF81267.1 hypothetical protein H110_07129 [Trichophy
MSLFNRPYVSNGHVLENPPLSAKIRRLFQWLYMFFGLYFVSLFSFTPYAAAEASQFNIKNPSNRDPRNRNRGIGRGGGGGGGGGYDRRGGGGGGPSKRIGRVDDVRGPECKSCQ